MKQAVVTYDSERDLRAAMEGHNLALAICDITDYLRNVKKSDPSEQNEKSYRYAMEAFDYATILEITGGE